MLLFPKKGSLQASPEEASGSWRAVFLIALGYMVDVYDLWLFTLYRLDILHDMGVAHEEVFSASLSVVDLQLFGLLLGGLLFGVIADRFGRKAGLFISIALYSLATLAASLAHELPLFIGLRFFSCIGLAGELSLGATMIQEFLPLRFRGVGALALAGVGASGALAGVLAYSLFEWRIAFLCGGTFGILLVFMRRLITNVEKVRKQTDRSALIRAASSRSFWKKLVAFLGIGLPSTSLFWMFTTFAPEFSEQLGVIPELTSGMVLMVMQTAYLLGDLAMIGLSHLICSRKRVFVGALILCGTGLLGLYCRSSLLSSTEMLAWCALLGLGTGFWMLFVVSCVEAFGRDVRGRMATLLPNLVRASPLLLFLLFGKTSSAFGVAESIFLLGGASLLWAAWGLFQIPETCGLPIEEQEDPSRENASSF